MQAPSESLLFLGRFHPVLVHLPIGFLVLLGALELLARSRRFQDANAGAGYVLALSVPACVAAAVCGWLLSLAGGYEASLLGWHKWMGIATSAACLVAALLYRLDLKKLYRWWLLGTLALLTVASHLGGSLTHGSGYLLEYAPATVRTWLGGKPVIAAQSATPPAGDVYQGVVQPMFTQYCIGCHGAEKAKGGLRLDAHARVVKGGDSGPLFVAGEPGASLLLRRIHLPPEDNEHMPPEGKPQPTEDDIALLEWWIAEGAPSGKAITDFKPPPHVARLLQKRLPSAAPAPAATPPKPLAEALAQSEPLARELGIAINALSQAEPWLQVNASPAAANFTDAALGRLTVLGANLRWLDLGGTGVTDAGLTNLAAMPNLERLHLERTAVTDAGLAQLAPLTQLNYLNLYGTAVGDAGLAALEPLRALRQIYLWQTQVAPTSAVAFAEARLDKAQLLRWQAELAQLQANLRNARIVVDTGTVSNTPAAATNVTSAAAANTVCPVSGKPAKADKTTVHEGRVIAFCCDDCKATFLKDPKPFLDKLPPAADVPKDKKP